mgnify:CR=1 FL=1
MKEHLFICCVSLLIALTVASILNPQLVYLSYRKDLTDKPNYRKLQHSPVPILGGMSVFLGTVISTLFLNFWMNVNELYMIIVSLMIMFFVGFLDDLIDLRVRTKFMFQIGVTLLLWYNGFQINTLAGAFGIYQISKWISLVLSVLTGVGLMNAINMIDGVDGLSSGFGITTSSICGLYFFLHRDFLFSTFACIFIGALIPFFLSNVFCRKYKMFIGDSGSLVMGTVAYIFVCRILQLPKLFFIDQYKVAMAFAIFAIPVTDTIRVMTMRALHHHSPFLPDKTHLHHILVALRLPHLAITLLELSMAAFIFFVGWGCSSLFGLSTTCQCLITISVAIVVSWGTYCILSLFHDHNPKQFDCFGIAIIHKTHWLVLFRKKIQKLIERR